MICSSALEVKFKHTHLRKCVHVQTNHACHTNISVLTTGLSGGHLVGDCNFRALLSIIRDGCDK
jgi:hypothetical protein